MKKINFKLLLGSLIASAFMILISNLMAFAIFVEYYTFDILKNSILLVITTIIIYYLMGE